MGQYIYKMRRHCKHSETDFMLCQFMYETLEAIARADVLKGWFVTYWWV